MILKQIQRKDNKINKKGQVILIVFIAVLFIILVAGFILSLASGVVKVGINQLTPVMSGLGVVGDTNMTQVSGYTFDKINTLANSLPWIVGLVYGLMIIGSIIFITLVPVRVHPVLMAFYFILVLALVFFSIYISNLYQDIYTSNDIISNEMQQQTLLAFMILHSPSIMAIIGIFTGLFLFAKGADSSGGSYGV